MTYILLAISMAACLIVGILRKYTSSTFKSDAMYYSYNAGVSLVCMISLALASGSLSVSPFTIALGVIFGLVTAMQYFFVLKAFRIGPFAYTSVITSLSLIIPTMSGAMFWGERITWIQGVGVALMILCIFLSVDFKSSEKKASLKWLIFTMISFVFTGLIGVMQKWHQNTDFRGELDGFLVIAFAISFMYSLTMAIINSKKSEESVKSGLTLKVILLIILAGVGAAANNKINLYLSGVMDSAVFFPVVNGGNLVLTAFCSFLIFAERLSVKKWTGVVVGICAVILLCAKF